MPFSPLNSKNFPSLAHPSLWQVSPRFSPRHSIVSPYFFYWYPRLFFITHSHSLSPHCHLLSPHSVSLSPHNCHLIITISSQSLTITPTVSHYPCRTIFLPSIFLTHCFFFFSLTYTNISHTLLPTRSTLRWSKFRKMRAEIRKKVRGP